MPAWTVSIPATDTRNSLTLVRTPAKGKTLAIVTSSKIIGCFTHYWGGHTMPCENEQCPACLEGIGNRWHGYIGIYDLRSRKHLILEFTAKASVPLQTYIEMTGKLRGCELQCERRGFRANSPVIMSCRPANLEGIALPEEPNIQRIMAIVWGLPGSAVKSDGAYNYAPLLKVDGEVMDQVNGPTKSRKALKKFSKT